MLQKVKLHGDEFESVGCPTEEQTGLIDLLEKTEEELRKCKELIFVTINERRNLEQFLSAHRIAMADCSTYSSTAYIYVTNLMEPLDGPAIISPFHQFQGGEFSQANRHQVKTRADVLHQWVSGIDLAHPETIVKLGKGQVRRSPPIGAHKDECEKQPNGEELVDRREKALRDIQTSCAC